MVQFSSRLLLYLILALFLGCPNEPGNLDPILTPNPESAPKFTYEPWLAKDQTDQISQTLASKWKDIKTKKAVDGIKFYQSHDYVFELAEFPSAIFKLKDVAKLSDSDRTEISKKYAQDRVDATVQASQVVFEKRLKRIVVPPSVVVSFLAESVELFVSVEKKYDGLAKTFKLVVEQYHDIYDRFETEPALKESMQQLFVEKIIFACHANLWDLKADNMPLYLDSAVAVDIEPGEELESALENHGKEAPAYLLATTLYVLFTGESTMTIGAPVVHPDFFEPIYQAAEQCAKERGLTWPVGFSEYVNPHVLKRIRKKYQMERIDKILPALKAKRQKSLEKRKAFAAYLKDEGIEANPQKPLPAPKTVPSKKIAAVLKDINQSIADLSPEMLKQPVAVTRTFNFSKPRTQLKCEELKEILDHLKDFHIFDAMCETIEFDDQSVTAYRIRA